ncbi:hypothetical protein BKA57DRAFT_21010 [Linnemannia elongata]|nr:hypothetical protein BKA57DRAFT_21010 [Linnemannia elongata]
MLKFFYASVFAFMSFGVWLCLCERVYVSLRRTSFTVFFLLLLLLLRFWSIVYRCCANSASQDNNIDEHWRLEISTKDLCASTNERKNRKHPPSPTQQASKLRLCTSACRWSICVHARTARTNSKKQHNNVCKFNQYLVRLFFSLTSLQRGSDTLLRVRKMGEERLITTTTTTNKSKV